MKIGIFGPSSACSPARYLKAKNAAQQLGYQMIEAHDPTRGYGNKQFLFACDSAEERVRALQQLLSDSSIQLVHAARGGYGAFDLLDSLADLKESLIKTPVKKSISLAGLSDVTTILLLLDGIPELNLIHGPGFLDAFCDYHDDSARKISTDKLMEIIEGTWNGYRDLSLTCISKSNLAINNACTGKLLGGNLSVLAALTGTGFLPEFAGRILFLEETGEKPYRVHRALSQLKYAGLFDKLLAVVLGNFDKCVHDQGLGPDIDEVLADIFGGLDYPVFKGFPGGHCALNLPLPFGKLVTLSSTSICPALDFE